MKLRHDEISAFVKEIFFATPYVLDEDPRLNQLDNIFFPEDEDDEEKLEELLTKDFSFVCRKARLLVLFLSFYLFPPEYFSLAYLAPSSAEDRAELFSDECTQEMLMSSLRQLIKHIQLDPKHTHAPALPDNAIGRLLSAFFDFLKCWQNKPLTYLHFSHFIQFNSPENHTKMISLCRTSKATESKPHRTSNYYLIEAIQNNTTRSGSVHFAECTLLAVPDLRRETIISPTITSFANLYVDFSKGAADLTFHTSQVKPLHDIMSHFGADSPVYETMTPVNGADTGARFAGLYVDFSKRAADFTFHPSQAKSLADNPDCETIIPVNDADARYTGGAGSSHTRLISCDRSASSPPPLVTSESESEDESEDDGVNNYRLCPCRARR